MGGRVRRHCIWASRVVGASAWFPYVVFEVLTEKSFLINKGINSKKNHINTIIIEISHKQHVDNMLGLGVNVGRSLWAKGGHSPWEITGPTRPLLLEPTDLWKQAVG